MAEKKMFYSKLGNYLLLLKLILLMPITTYFYRPKWKLRIVVHFEVKLKITSFSNKIAKISYFDMPYIAFSLLLLEVQLFVKNSF